ncbi:hypothetical protein ACFSR7_03710 [Cohnella sp. GCM10020058]
MTLPAWERQIEAGVPDRSSGQQTDWPPSRHLALNGEEEYL